MKLKHYELFIDDNDEMYSISDAKFKKLQEGEVLDSLSWCKGKKVRMASIVVAMEDSPRVCRATFDYMYFKNDGRMDWDKFSRACAAAASNVFDGLIKDDKGENTKGNVVDASKIFNKKTEEEVLRWPPSEELKAKILNALIAKSSVRRA